MRKSPGYYPCHQVGFLSEKLHLRTQRYGLLSDGLLPPPFNYAILFYQGKKMSWADGPC